MAEQEKGATYCHREKDRLLLNATEDNGIDNGGI
jgi:hypothetical protein